MDLQKIIQNYVGGMVAEKIGQKMGLSGNQAQTLAARIMLLLLGGMVKNATSSSDGAASLVGALTKDHDGSIFENIETLVSSPEQFKGAKILQHILGDKEVTLEKALAQEEGLEQEKVKGMMTMLAPLVMGALGKEQSKQSLGMGDFMEMFDKQKAEQKKVQNPLLGLLDSDGDGSMANDILGLGMDMLKKKM